MRQGGVLTGEVNAAIRSDNVVVQQSLLTRTEEDEGTSRELVVVPNLRGAAPPG
jgi:hypothetical protein